MSATKSKVTRKNATGRKKPIPEKKASVTLTQMVGSSDNKRSPTTADTENVCGFYLLHYILFIHIKKRCKYK